MSDAPPSSTETLDITANRRARKWSNRALAGRGLWEASWFLFAWSPRQLWWWRNGMLRLFGARIGRRVQIHPTVRIATPWNVVVGDNTAVGDGAILYSLGTITLGSDVTISQYVHLCAGTHDYQHPALPLMKPPISIGRGAWVCADAFVGPDIHVGDFAIVGARAVVTKDVAPWTIVAGNPARAIAVRPPPRPR